MHSQEAVCFLEVVNYRMDAFSDKWKFWKNFILWVIILGMFLFMYMIFSDANAI